MRNYWSLIGNGKYQVGCTGQTVYVLDNDGNEIAKFKDLIYAYTPAISPNGDIFVVKTTEGRLAVYSFSPPKLIKKFRFSKVDASQDDNFCFSPDGKELYNIERHVDSCKTALSVYDTSDFSLKKRLLDDDDSLVLDLIEADTSTGEYFLLGLFRNEQGIAYKYFVGKLIADRLEEIVYVPEKVKRFYYVCQLLRVNGFTEKMFNLWHDCWIGPEIKLEELKKANHTLAELWSLYRNQSN